EVRPAGDRQEQLADAWPEDRAQAESLRRRHGLVLPERRGRELQRLLAEKRQPGRDGGNRLPAPRPALLGPACAGAARQDDEADRKVRAAGSRHQDLALPVIATPERSARPERDRHPDEE